MNKSYIITILLAILSVIVKAQHESTRISGIVIDSLSKQPLPYANIQAIKESTQYSAITDSKGNYSFSKIPLGEYTIMINYVGYVTKKSFVSISAQQTTINVNPIALQLDNINLKQVTVKAMRPFIEQNMDKMMLNVAESIMANSGSSLDVLRRAPSVQISDHEGIISFRGKKVMIMVDGKLTQLTGEGLESFLSSVPSNSIDKIELISNPSAKYEASGLAIINIKTLKMRSMGINGNYNLGIGTGVYARYNAGGLINYRKNKFSLFANYNYQFNKQYYHLNSSRVLGTSKFFNDAENDIRSRNLQYYKAMLDYEITPKSSIGLIFQGDKNDRFRGVTSMTHIGFASRVDSTISMYSDGDAVFDNWNANLFYKHRFDNKGKELAVDIDYGEYRTDWQEKIMNQYFNNENNNPYRAPIFLNIPWLQQNDIRSFKADYTHPMRKVTLETGLQSRLTSMEMDFSYQTLVSNQWTKDQSKSNLFNYSENVNAAYANISGKYLQWNYQVGLRTEQTIVTVQNLGINTSNKQNYWQVFPSASIQKDILDKKRLNISYTRRISRPSYGELNGQLFYWNQYRQTVGNPYLQPTIINSIETGLAISKSLTSSVSYRWSKNTTILQPILLSNNVTLYRSQNVKGSEAITWDNVYNKALTSWWTTSSGLQVIYTKNNFGEVANLISNQIVSGYAYTNHYFNTKKGLKFEILAYYLPKQVFGTYILEPRSKVDIGVQKNILGKNGDIRLSVSDVFDMFVSQYTFASTVQVSETIKPETRFIRLTFTYKFGNSNVKIKERKLGLESESSRINTGK
jgi:iron complex outermembrane recepter protein